MALPQLHGIPVSVHCKTRAPSDVLTPCLEPAITVHVFEASERGRQASYKLTSTVMLYLVKPLATAEADGSTSGDIRLGGSMTRQVRVQQLLIQRLTTFADCIDLDRVRTTRHHCTCRQTEVAGVIESSRAHSSHVENIGKMIEDMEGKMRNSLQEVYFSSQSAKLLGTLAGCWLTLTRRLYPDHSPSTETKDITQALRSSAGFGEQNKMRALQGELVGLLKGRKQAA